MKNQHQKEHCCSSLSHNQCGHGDEANDLCISVVPIFNHLEREQMEEIKQVVKSSSYKKGEILYREGDKSDFLYIVRKGKIRIYRLSESGKEQLLRILNPGDFTGELALFRESIHESYAEAMCDTDVCLISRDDLQELLIKYPSISLKILSEFSNRLVSSERQTARFATERVETRLAKFLLECIDNNSDSLEIELPMSKKDLASYLGTTPETLSRKLSDFEDEGYIKQKTGKRISILNVDALSLL